MKVKFLSTKNRKISPPPLHTIPSKPQTAFFSDIRLVNKFEQNSIAKLAPRVTSKGCWPSNLERQNIKLAFRIFNDSTSAALKICNDARLYPSKTKPQTSSLWCGSCLNINSTNKYIRLNDEYSKQLVLNDPRFYLVYNIVNWLSAWKSLPVNHGKFSAHTFTSFKHTYQALPILVDHLTSQMRILLRAYLFLTNLSTRTSLQIL